MIQCNKHLAIVSIIFSFATFSVAAQENLLNYENSLKFARYLSTTRNYTYAAEEYERINFLWPRDTTVILELVQTYRLDNDCSQFQNSFDLFSADNRLFTNQKYAKEYLRFCLTCKIEHPQYFSITSGLEKEEGAFYSLSYFWANKMYDSAFHFNNTNANIISSNFPQLYDLTASFEAQKYKKPMLALAMSMVLPGSGKAYSKRWGDAAVSLLLVASSAFTSYRAFRQKGIRSFNGWIFGGVALSFYSSNLYGSYKSAVTYNEQIRHQYQHNAESIIYSNY